MRVIILGISIGTRITGVAVINSKKLVAWETHAYPETWSESKLEKILSRYEKHIRVHRVTAVVVKIPRLTHHNDAITALLTKLASLVKFHCCMLDYTEG